MNTVKNGKGSMSRKVDKNRFDVNYESINWRKNMRYKELLEKDGGYSITDLANCIDLQAVWNDLEPEQRFLLSTVFGIEFCYTTPKKEKGDDKQEESR